MEDFPEQQDWIQDLIQPLNEFMQSVINALSSDLTLTENLRANIKTLRITGSSNITGDIISGSSTIFNPSSLEGLRSRLFLEGTGVSSEAEISSIFDSEFIDTADTSATGTSNITGISSTANYRVGQPISGPGIPINTTVYAITNSTSIMLDKPLISGGSASSNIKLSRGILMSEPATQSLLGAKINCGGSYPIYFQYTMNVRPSIVFIGAIIENSANPEIIKTAPFVDWSLGQNQVIIRNITGLTAGNEYTITFVLLGG